MTVRTVVFLLGALTALAQAPTPRQELKDKMRASPQEAWPRGIGHTILAWPHSSEPDKAYHEPGGSFSPAVGSFGVQIRAGDITSDTVPLADVRQRMRWKDGPAIETVTPRYTAFWSTPKPGIWTLDLEAKGALSVLIRSAGPAGGPVHSLDWNGSRLIVNGKWTLTARPAPVDVQVGGDRAGGWGWAAIRAAASRLHLEIASEPPDVPPFMPPASFGPRLKIPDKRFEASLQAQVMHLLMSLVNGQTRPGEPTNYPLAWLRDGAYTLTALARAGQFDTAKRLSRYFAENDFFGGFGAEADGPGLALWALEETAVRLKDPGHDRWLWPHAERKAALILEMLSVSAPLRKSYAGPIVPRHLKNKDLDVVCDAARDGLIVGRMDHHRPLLFVNAVSYRGLLSAAELAERLGHATEATRWRATATGLQAAWHKAFRPPEADNERTYISGIWPSGIAAGMEPVYLKGLEDRWRKIRGPQGEFLKTPLWTYFEVADAHQWLLLGRPDRAWQTIRWFWDHQASPGLYTWWEGEGEENTFHRWEDVRGWVNPPHVTPHYWVASEMLLLQLDALAWAAPDGTITIGPGVPGDWLAKSVSVEGISMPQGSLDWNWDGRRLHVTGHGWKPRVKPGPAFPAGTQINE